MTKRTIRRWPNILAVFAISLIAAAVTPAQAQDNEAIHLGVQTCAASTCHGAVQPWQNSVVLQNEYVVWSTHDAHSGAYKALLSDHAKNMAARLGIGAAHESELCLGCHTDNVAEDRRGKNFDIADGVGCEACHGGAENWLGTHVSGVSSRPELVAIGMYPTEDPVARAELCLGCHQPNADKMVTHRIMAVGHPRLTFELDTFSVNQPAHARIDNDYRQRKPVADGANMWAIGQGVAAREHLLGLAKSMRGRSHLFPELTFFECGSCHHSHENAKWRPQPGVGLGPGEPQLYDANLVMLRAIAEARDPELAASLRNQTRALHRATRQGAGAVARAAETLAATADRMTQSLADSPLRESDLRAALAALTSSGLAADYNDFGAAEQATMAAASLMAALGDTNTKVLDPLYDATQSPARYNSRGFANALAQLRNYLQ